VRASRWQAACCNTPRCRCRPPGCQATLQAQAAAAQVHSLVPPPPHVHHHEGEAAAQELDVDKWRDAGQQRAAKQQHPQKVGAAAAEGACGGSRRVVLRQPRARQPAGGAGTGCSVADHTQQGCACSALRPPALGAPSSKLLLYLTRKNMWNTKSRPAGHRHAQHAAAVAVAKAGRRGRGTPAGGRGRRRRVGMLAAACASLPAVLRRT